MSGTEQREAAIGLRDTFGQVAKDVSGKAGDFHDLTADAASQGAHALADTDSEFGGKLNDLGNDPAKPPTPKPSDPVASPGGDATRPSGPVTDDFSGSDEGGQNSEGDENTPSCNDPVDPVSGQLLISGADVELPGVLPLVLRRAYATGYRHGALFGPGWSSTLDQRLVIDDDGIHFLGDDAQTLAYGIPTQPGEQMLPAAGARWPLSWDRKLDAIRVLDPGTGLTLHFAAPPHPVGPDPRGRASREVRYLTRVTDRNGNWLTIARDADNVPTQIDHVCGYRIEVDSSYRGGSFRIEGLRLLDGSREGALLIGYSYDPAGRLVEILDAAGAPLIYEYDDADRICAWIDRAGYRFDYGYDADGRIARSGGEDGTLAAVFEYDRQARCTRVTDSLQAVTEYWYDEHNHLSKIVDPLGGTALLSHDRYGKLVERTDALGNTTRIQRDRWGRELEILWPDGARYQARYNELGQPVHVIAASGAVSTCAYDERGNLTAATDPLGAVYQYEYDERGGLAGVTDPLGNRTALELNAAGLPLSITDPLGARSSVVRGARGEILRRTDPLGAISITEFDPQGRPVAQTHPDGTRETWTYDARGYQASHTNRAGFQTRLEYGPFRRLTARVEPDGTRHEFAYDGELRLTRVTGPNGAVWTYTYDAAGNRVAETDFNGRSLTYGYDPAGQLVRRINGAGQNVELVRDTLGRVVEQRGDNGQAVTYAFNLDGELVGAANRDSEITLLRDAAGRVLAETINGLTLSNTFDELGRRISRTTPSGHLSTWQYDAAGRPDWVTVRDRRISFGHDLAGRETHRWLSDEAALTHEWDPSGRLTVRRLLAVTGPAEARVSNLRHEQAWAYRADGVPEAFTDTAQTRQFTLDPLGRVTAVHGETWSEQYTYDPAGNLLEAVDTRAPDAATGGPRELTGTLLRQAGRTRYEYDAQGRLTTVTRRTLSGGSKTWTYAYDVFDRQVEAVLPSGERWRYRYDPLGRRIGKQRVDADGHPVEEVGFTWDGFDLAEQQHRRAEDPRIGVTTWVYQPGTWTPLSQDSRAYYAAAPQEVVDEQFHAIITDLVGTPTELVSPDGTVAWRRTASLWGGALPGDGEGHGVSCLLRSPGQYHDAETGLDYNHQRYYDPSTGRYMTPDPLGLEPSSNHHAYVPNPLSWLDPLGLAGETEGTAGGAGDGVEWADPTKINFSQRSVASNDYAELMKSGKWDWTRPGTALRVLEVNGQLVTYDNRRLNAALEAGETRVAIDRVDPSAPDGISTAGRTWQQAFDKRFRDPRNVKAGGRVPPEGLSTRPVMECPKK